MRARLGSALAPLALALALLAGCSRAPEGEFSGYVEGDLLFIGPQEAGRVLRLPVAEGTKVTAGTVLAELEPDIQSADLAAAAALLGEAQAKLARLKAATQRPEEIAILEASERRLTTALDLSRIELQRQKTLVPKGASSQANLDTAQHSYDQAVASLDEVRRQIDVARIAGRDEDIAAAAAAVRSAAANRDAAQIRLDRRILKAPREGTVQTLYFRPGELVPEGKPVVSVLPPDLIKVRFFVPEAQLPKVALGANVAVQCDGCPPLTAQVTFIADSAEYTPPVIYSREERAKLVYLVEARPSDPAAARPGQPVTVRLAEGKP
ncbi:HlyD family efflux transporter periplasmic adaptor subunit [Aquabacter sp. L1I39]|uniref:HlyD family secretion protein n=1 Tax=Aquabacter sp. L1I39 TaxID=2820278 RepID=UPI001ADB5096|nr:HlyD family efflux transporter periplasmic adaptor subunit [Aquabacter sp. L1I39]QTL05252.1 HlyD family efflux transporter periplasmic adaptor subunit [Aquabacter sp. L1I39]